MQIKFGEHAYTLRRLPRVNGSLFTASFEVGSEKFESIKAVLSSESNTQSIEVDSGNDVKVYANFTVLRQVSYVYESDGTTTCGFELSRKDLQEQVNDQKQVISEQGSSIDSILAEVIPAIMDEVMAYISQASETKEQSNGTS